MTYDVVDLTKALISCRSVTPEDAGALVFLEEKMAALGFTCYRLPFGEGADKVQNLFARLGNGAPHFCYGGHTDVVPPGAEEKWTYGAFNPHIEDGVLYGRGASDMKGSVAAFVAAVAAYLKDGAPNGSISLLITGDEEGPAVNGTVKVLEWMAANGHIPDVALVGEPTNPDHLGEQIKIGRRGSLSGRLGVDGKQGHVAYPHLAHNPLPRLVKMVDALCDFEFDQGTDYFLPTNLEVTTIDVGNTADNVIPDCGSAKFNIRFNDIWTSETLEAKIRDILNRCGGDYTLDTVCGAESFMTKPGAWSRLVRDAVHDVTGKRAAFTTTGGTSDARFMSRYCDVVEFGGVNASIHQIDENARVSDLRELALVFERVLRRYFG